MTIEEIAKDFDDCANGKCQKCEFKHINIKYCQSYKIRKMAQECREIAKTMQDDGK